MEKLTLNNITYKGNKIYDQDGNYRGEILYRYIRGSQLYHTNVATSDVDEGGVYIMPDTARLGLGFEYQNEIKDEKGDKVIWEIGRFLELTLSGNPTVLEALFVPDDKVIYEHPVMKELRSHRDEFVTKKCFKPFGGYAVSQVKKAQGQNKKIHWDIKKMVRKTPLDFCYTPYKQGSMPMKKWLHERGLMQRNCGLVSIPHMDNTFGVYYDFGQHIKLKRIKKDFFCDEKNYETNKFINFCYHYLGDEWEKENLNYEDVMYTVWNKYSTPKGGYCGIISPNKDKDSNEIRFASVPDKNDRALCLMSYNGNHYATHCREYKEYMDWKEHRNKARYESNMEGEKSGDPDMKYDCKNIMHCFRLMAMAKEIAEGKGIILDRTGIDRDFLLDIRNRKFGYSVLQKKMSELKNEMDKAIEESTIKEDVSPEYVNELLLTIRNKYGKENKKCTIYTKFTTWITHLVKSK